MIFRHLLLAEARGKLGDEVWSRNRAGPYSRSRGTPVDPATAPQVAARARFNFLQDRWAAFTDDERIAWNTYAQRLRLKNSLGEPSRVSGKAAYLRFNNWRYNTSWVPYLYDDPPPLATFAPAPIFVSFSAEWDVSSAFLDVLASVFCYSAPTSSEPQTLLSLHISDPRATTHYAYHRSWTFIAYNGISLITGQPQSITGEDARPIWNTAGGDACFLKVSVCHEDGRMSIPVITRAVTTSRP